MNIYHIVQLYDRWMKALPQIRVHYAVKANSDSVLLQLMTLLGAGFDCASKVGVAQGRVDCASKVGVAQGRVDCASKVGVAQGGG